MRSKDICNQRGFDVCEFEDFVRQNYVNEIDYEEHFQIIGKLNIKNQVIIDDYDKSLQKKEKEKQKEIEVETEKQRALAKIFITSGFSFDGFRIAKYSGYISGDDITRISQYEGLFASSSIDEAFTDALVAVRRNALMELKEAAYALGCNAVIGVDYDYLTLQPQYNSVLSNTVVNRPLVVCVTANGNAVVIEKIEE